ncbi:hypothetical protein ACJQWK_09094 [Exserohilum turcicum]
MCGDKAVAQTQIHLSRVSLDEEKQNADRVSPTLTNTLPPDTSKAKTLRTSPSSPPWIPGPSQQQETTSFDTPAQNNSNAQGEKLEVEDGDTKPLDGMAIDESLSVTALINSGTSPQGQVNNAAELDERSVGREANGMKLEDDQNDNTKSHAYCTSNSAQFYETLLLTAAVAQQQVPEELEAGSVKGLQVALEVPDHTHIECEVSKSGILDEKDFSTVQRDIEKGEMVSSEIQLSLEGGSISGRTPLPSEETDQVVSRESNEQAASLVASLPEPPVEGSVISPPSEFLACNDEAGQLWQTQLQDAANGLPNLFTQDNHGHDETQDEEPHKLKSNDTVTQDDIAGSEHLHSSTMTLPPFPFHPDKDENDEQDKHPPTALPTSKDKEPDPSQADETSTELSEAPSHIDEAVYGISPADTKSESAFDSTANNGGIPHSMTAKKQAAAAYPSENNASMQVGQPGPKIKATTTNSDAGHEPTKRAKNATGIGSKSEPRKKASSNVSEQEENINETKDTIAQDNAPSHTDSDSSTSATKPRKQRKPIARKLFPSHNKSDEQGDPAPHAKKSLEDSPAVSKSASKSSTTKPKAGLGTPDTQAQNSDKATMKIAKKPQSNTWPAKTRKRKATAVDDDDDDEADFKSADDASDSDEDYAAATPANTTASKKRKVNTRSSFPRNADANGSSSTTTGGAKASPKTQAPATTTTNKYGFTVKKGASATTQRGGNGKAATKKTGGAASASASATNRRGAKKTVGEV